MLRRPFRTVAAIFFGFAALAAAADLPDAPLPAGAVRLFGTTRFRSGTALLAVADGGKTVITLSPTGVLRWFDAETGRLRRERLLPLPEGTFETRGHLRLAPDGSIAVLSVIDTDGRGRETIAWTTADARQVWRHANRRETLVGVDLSADGGRLAALIYDGAVNGSNYLEISDRRTSRLWTIADLGRAVEVRLAPDGKRALVGAAPSDNAVTWTCFEVETGRKLWDGARAGRKLSFSADGARVFIDKGSDPQGLIVLDTATGWPAAGVTLPAEGTWGPWPPAVAPTGSAVLIRLPSQGYPVLWDYRAGKPLVQLPYTALTGPPEPFPLLAFAPDGRFVYSVYGQYPLSDTDTGRLQRWDMTTGRPAYPATEDDGHTRPIVGMKFSPDGRELVSVSTDRRYFRWDAAMGQRIASGPVTNGLQYLSTIGIGDKQMIFERLAGSASVRPELEKQEGVLLRRPPGYSVASAPTADGRAVLSLSDNAVLNRRLTLTVFDREEPMELRSSVTLPWSPHIPPYPFSPCGRWVVIDGAVIHTATGKTVLKPVAHVPGGPQGVALWTQRSQGYSPGQVWCSPDGRFLAGALDVPPPSPRSRAETVAVWELASGQAFRTFLTRYDDQVTVSPGGWTVVRTGLPGVVVHNLLTGAATVLPRRDGPDHDHTRNQAVAFTPDVRSFVTGHEDGTIIQWAVPSPDWPEPSAVECEALWAALAESDVMNARPAVERLVRHPAVAITLLRARFVPPAAPKLDDLPAVVRDLDAASFAVREAASRKLHDLGDGAELLLRTARDANGSAELRRRVDELLARITPTWTWQLPLSGDLLRNVRAIEILERVGSAEAKELLAAWRAQTRSPRLAAEADLALGRLR